jgi:ubiquinone/menaquinone biosynthesis C-methylase UbiE
VADAQAQRERMREFWNTYAPLYREFLAKTGYHSDDAAMEQWLIAHLNIGQGSQVMDLACGNGNPSLLIASLVGPTGTVLGLDLSPVMIEAARARAKELSLSNVSYALIDDETRLPVEPEGFDAAICQMGIFFMPNPIQALIALREAVKPGGRVGLATWGDDRSNGLLTVPREIIARHTSTPFPPRARPAVLTSVEELRDAYEQAGLRFIEAIHLMIPAREAPDAATCWERLIRGSPLEQMLAQEPPEVVEAIQRDAVESLERYRSGDEIRVMSEVICSVAERP